MRQGRPLPVPVPRLDLRPRRHASSGPSTPRTSTTSASTPTAWRPIRVRDLAGLRVPVLRPTSRSTPGSRRSSATSSTTWRGSTSPRSGRRSRSCTRSGSNWKFIAENYSECYHCPGVHPQLNKLTPYDLGGDFDPNGAWQGGWMELVDGRRDDGARRRPRLAARAPADVRDHARPTSSGSTTTSCGRRRSCRSTPTTCSSTAWCRSTATTPRSSATGCSRARPSTPRASTRRTRSRSGTSPTARTGTCASSSSAGPRRAAGSPAATRTRRRRCRRST